MQSINLELMAYFHKIKLHRCNILIWYLEWIYLQQHQGKNSSLMHLIKAHTELCSPTLKVHLIFVLLALLFIQTWELEKNQNNPGIKKPV